MNTLFLRFPLAIGVLLLASTPAFAASILNFPRISNEDQTLTGIAFVNTSPDTAVLRITLFDDQGQIVTGSGLTNPVDLEIGPGRQLARTVSEVFGAPLAPGLTAWMQAVSETEGITGFYLYLNYEVSFFDGADGPESGRKIVFGLAREDEAFSSEFNLVNPFDTPVELDLRLHRPAAEAISRAGLPIPAKGVYRFNLREMFSLEEVVEGSYLSVLATGPVSGFQFVREAGKDIIGLNAPLQDQGLGELYFPQMAAAGPWRTELGLVNHGNQAALVTISAYRSNGTLFSSPDVGTANPVVVNVGPEQGVVRDVAQLFGFSGEATLDGWLKVESSSPRLVGFVSYGVLSAGSWASVAAQAKPLSKGIFSHLATTLGYFTGVAVLNPNSLATSVRISSYSGEGELLGTHLQVLQPGWRDSRLITELVPDSLGRGAGYIEVQSELPVFMTSLFGTSRILANIPPQPYPGGGLPDAEFRIQPPLAVVQPGRPFQFGIAGADGPVQWSVLGDSLTGQIDDQGKYTAPFQPPARLPVSVSAGGENSIAAASVDVLSKEQLLADVGVVQAVAYLRGLQRLYVAELAAQNLTSGAFVRLQQAEPASRVVSVAPGGRIELAEFPGEVISKIVPFESSRGGDYLLLLNKTRGTVIRFDPTTRNQVRVVQGLTSPDSMVFDETSGNLLVADQSEIRSFTRALIESPSGLEPANHLADREFPGQNQEAGQFTGIAIDQCTGDLIVSDKSRSIVVAIDRITGDERVLSSGYAAPGELLSLYRVGGGCPEAFHLLAADPEASGTSLVSPGLEVDLDWVGDRNIEDLAFLPPANPITGSASVVFVELATTTTPGTTSTLASVATFDLYSDRPGNPPPRPSGRLYGDPAGDTLPPGAAIDLLALEVYPSETSATVFLLMAGTTVPGVTLTGFLDFDTDQDQRTGTTSHVDRFSALATGLGVEATVDLASYDPDEQTVGWQTWNGSTYEETGRIPLTLVHDPESLEGTTSLEIQVPGGFLALDFRFDLAAVVGDPEAMTDIAPNRGFLRSGNGP